MFTNHNKFRTKNVKGLSFLKSCHHLVMEYRSIAGNAVIAWSWVWHRSFAGPYSINCCQSIWLKSTCALSWNKRYLIWLIDWFDVIRVIEKCNVVHVRNRIVIVNSWLLQLPQKQSHGNQLFTGLFTMHSLHSVGHQHRETYFCFCMSFEAHRSFFNFYTFIVEFDICSADISNSLRKR